MKNEVFIDRLCLPYNFKSTKFITDNNIPESFTIYNALSCFPYSPSNNIKDGKLKITLYHFDLILERDIKNEINGTREQYCLSDIIKVNEALQIRTDTTINLTKMDKNNKLTYEIIKLLGEKFNFKNNLVEGLIRNFKNKDCKEIILDKPIEIKIQDKFMHSNTIGESYKYYITKVKIKGGS